MQSLKVIIPFDSRCCSLNCRFNQTYTGTCTVRGDSSDQVEKVGRDGELYLRTPYCIENASSESWPSGKVTHLPVNE